ncbi:Outer-membrane lipoprotein carrier protein [Gammaproteobacteria bacterium]
MKNSIENSIVRSLVIVVVLFVFLAMCPVQAQVIDSLRAFLKDLTDLRADFHQVEYDEHQKEVRQSHGTLNLQRPGRFRWEYKSPYLQTIISDGKYVWFYDHDLAQVTVKPYTNALANSPALLLSSDTPLEHDFQIKEAGTRDGIEWIELRPQTSDAGFIKAEVGFIGKELRSMELLDNFSQMTRLTFSNLRRNLSLSADLFQFHPPPGVDVVGKIK